MIVPSKRQIIYHSLVYGGWSLLGLLVYDIVVVILYQTGHLRWKALDQIPLSLFGSVIGVILAFRNTSSYARWWEARMLWGAIVNNTRSVGREVTTALRPAAEHEQVEVRETQRQLVYLQIAWVHALRQHLRKLPPWEDLTPFLSKEEIEQLQGQQNVPLALQQKMSIILRNARNRGWIDMTQWLALDQNIDDLVDAQGASERIKNTPLPRQYDYFPQICVYIYCVLLPLAMVSSLGWFTPLGSTLVGFIFMALNRIGRDLEDPFGQQDLRHPLDLDVHDNRDQSAATTRRDRPAETATTGQWRALVVLLPPGRQNRSAVSILAVLCRALAVQQNSKVAAAGCGVRPAPDSYC
jgi:putative membrane protein